MRTESDPYVPRAASPRVEALFAEKGAVVLAVPFAEKGAARELGAVWYAPKLVWFVPNGLDVSLFHRWLVKAPVLALSPEAAREVQIEAFRKELLTLGLADPGEIIDDGAWHNVAVTTKPGFNKSGSYILSMSGGRYGQPIGTIMNKHTGQSLTWTHSGATMTPEQRAKARAEAIARESLAAAQALKAQDEAALHAQQIWDAASVAEGHGYILKKGISANGLRQVAGSVLRGFAEFVGESGGSVIRADEDYLLVPMSTRTGELRALQAISADGTVKTFMRGAQKKGTMAVFGAASFDVLSQSENVCFVGFGEGLATMASFREVSKTPLSDTPVVVCFDAGNLEHVAASLIPDLPANVASFIAVDNDQFFMERALGFAVASVGLNPIGNFGHHAVLTDGAASHRPVAMGDMVLDGQWHQAPFGKYCAKTELECGAVRALTIQAVPSDGNLVAASFTNRGLEAGRKVQSLCAQGHRARAVILACPVFASLDGRPTDWNDLVQREGLVSAGRALRASALLGVEKLPTLCIDVVDRAPVPSRASSNVSR